MKISKLALGAMIAGACFAGSASAQQGRVSPQGFRQVSYNFTQSPSDSKVSTACGCTAPACDSGCAAADPGCDACGPGGCDSGGGCDSKGGGCCDLGEPWTLFKNDNCYGIKVAGWTQLGYSTRNDTMFNTHPDRVRLAQQWFYAERVADGSNGLDFGGRIDYLYGTDAQDTQSFGTLQTGFDNPWDNGIYGHAIPQAYAEVAYGKLSAKIGHFFTLIGYEVVAATGNFFYSHSYTMYNSEPFTHTGVLTSYKADDDTTLYNGYVLGWDSGFDDNGDAYLGGFSRNLGDGLSLAYGTCIGTFGRLGGQNEVGQMHSAILTNERSDKLKSIWWVDYLDSNTPANRARQRETFSINHIMLYSFNDCLSIGGRSGWYNVSNGVFGVPAGQGNSDIYSYTIGLNYKPSANFLVRPEVRRDWDRDGILGFETGTAQTNFAMDTVFTF